MIWKASPTLLMNVILKSWLTQLLSIEASALSMTKAGSHSISCPLLSALLPKASSEFDWTSTSLLEEETIFDRLIKPLTNHGVMHEPRSGINVKELKRSDSSLYMDLVKNNSLTFL